MLVAGFGTGFAPRAAAESARVGQTVAQIESLTPLQAEQQRVRRQMEAQPAAYEDKVMDASALSELESSDASAQMSDDGLGLRTFGMESRYGFSSYNGSGGLHNRANEFGQRVYFTQQTLNYGEWNLQAEGRFRNGDEGFNGGMLGYSVQRSSARVTLRNYGLPVMAGVFADYTDPLLVESGLASSKRVARELLAAGAISLNGEIRQDEQLSAKDRLFERYLLLRRGKKQYRLVEWVD